VITQGTLPVFLRSLLTTDLPDGWLYLPEGELAETTICMFIPSADVDWDENEVEDGDEGLRQAAQLGFPFEGLDNQTLQDVARGAVSLDPDASDALLVRAFAYYHRFDAFLPSIDAPDPPAPEQSLLKMDRDFYDSLGAESLEMRCRREGCDRGTVHLSACCRQHHFENVRQRPCPFE
jgi:hypothetical protein